MSPHSSEPVGLARRPRPTAHRILLSLLLMSACARADAPARPAAPLRIGGIPDQDLSRLERTEHLERRAGVPVEYVPSNDYAALVIGFQRGDVQLAWFGGLTGVQALAVTPDAHALTQRPRNADFHSVFIVGAGVRAASLAQLEGLSFTFGSES